MAERGTIFCLASRSFSDLASLLHRNLPGGVRVEYSDTAIGTSIYIYRQINVNIVYDLFTREFDETKQVWLAVSLEEGATWSYVLHRGSRAVDRFCTSRAYWGEMDQMDWSGNPELISSLFSVPADRINRYLVPWTHMGDGQFAESGLAYPDDYPDCGYGAVYQCVAFFEALGFAWPSVEWIAS